MKIRISGAQLVSLASVSVCASSDKAVWHLQGVELVADSAGDTLQATATDRFTAARILIHDADTVIEVPGTVVLAAKDLAHAAKVFGKDAAVAVKVEDDWAEFAGREQVLRFAVMAVQFPDMGKIIPARELREDAHGSAAFNPEYLAKIAKVKPFIYGGRGKADIFWQVFAGAQGKPWLWVCDSARCTAEFLIMPKRLS